MPNTFFASDHHLGHANILIFKNYDGSPVRTFSDVNEMNEHIIEKHNSVVGPKDTCWFGGDAVINRRYLHLFHRFNGRKRLILGNHDIFKNKDYYDAGFEDLHAFRKFDKFVMQHFPMHPESLTERYGFQVHGHLHGNKVKRPMYTRNGKTEFDPILEDKRYINVSMECLNDYTPMSIDEIHDEIANRK